MDCANDLNEGLALGEGTLVAILTDDGQFALLDDAEIDDVMMVPSCFGARGKGYPAYRQFGFL